MSMMTAHERKVGIAEVKRSVPIMSSEVAQKSNACTTSYFADLVWQVAVRGRVTYLGCCAYSFFHCRLSTNL